MDRTQGAAACTVVLVGSVLIGSCVKEPVSVRQQARKVQCASNLRQIGIAAALYLSEHRAYPFAEAGASGTPRKGCEHLQILFDEGFLDDPEVVICGASIDPPPSMNADGKFALTSVSCSYIWARGPLDDASPAKTPLAADKAERDGMKGNCHPGGRNVLYLDGSVKWVSTEKFEKEIRKQLTPE